MRELACLWDKNSQSGSTVWCSTWQVVHHQVGCAMDLPLCTAIREQSLGNFTKQTVMIRNTPPVFDLLTVFWRRFTPDSLLCSSALAL